MLWGIYIKKCISQVRICLQTRNARNASTKFRKTSESKKWSIRFANMKHKPAACMKWQLRCREAKRAVAFPCAEGTLHRAKPCFTSCCATRFMRRKARFIEKSTCLRKCFFLAGIVGLEPTKCKSQSLVPSPTWLYPIIKFFEKSLESVHFQGFLCQHWAIVPARLQASIVATAKLNFCVRNGNRWTFAVWSPLMV